MKTLTILALFAGATLSRHVDRDMPCRVKHNTTIEEVVKTPLVHTADLPEAWNYQLVNGKTYLTNIRNQHIPQYCGSCWAHAATSAFSDRIKLARNASWPDINISPQSVISCSYPDQGCHGGWALSAFQYMHRENVTEETCSIYRARGHDNGVECSPIVKCQNCNPSGPCFIPDTYPVHHVDQFGQVSGEENMMQEIYQRGPIACGIAVPDALEDYTSGIFNDSTGDLSIVHDISVVGYGVEEETGEKYWVVRNSWGSHWGENGFFRVIRGTNNIAIESDCSWATPTDTWTNPWIHHTTQEEQDDPRNDVSNGDKTTDVGFLKINKGDCRIEKADFGVEGEFINQRMSWDIIDVSTVPANLDWRNMNGINYCGWSVNQHIPQYCGSCWAQGSTSALGDRFNILLNDTNPTPIDLNAQVIVNCAAGGTCQGGNPIGVYKYAKTTGIPDSSCMQYVAANLDHAGTCEPIDICRDCSGPPPAANETGLDGCTAVDYKKYFVSSYYALRGADNMKTELYLNGPISCGVDATSEFDDYSGGIYSQVQAVSKINHEISVVGYGFDEVSEQEYWIGRNSWGTYWGENGFFRILMHKDNLSIENDCTAGIPSFESNNVETSQLIQ